MRANRSKSAKRITKKIGAFSMSLFMIASMPGTGTLSAYAAETTLENTAIILSADTVSGDISASDSVSATISDITDSVADSSSVSGDTTAAVSDDTDTDETDESALTVSEDTVSAVSINDAATVSSDETDSGNETVSEDEASAAAEADTGDSSSEDAAGTDGTLTVQYSGGTTIEPTVSDGVTVYTLSENTAYDISGSDASKTRIEITASQDVTLNLNGISIDNSSLSDDEPVINAGGNVSTLSLVLSGSNVIKGNGAFTEAPAEGIIMAGKKGQTIIVSGDGNLTVNDGMSAATDFNSADPSAGIFSKGGVTIAEGTGTITVNTCGECIKGTNTGVDISGGTLKLTSNLSDCIKSKSAHVNITGGNITTEYSYGDAINSKEGTVNISGGAVNITECHEDGIQAEDVNISDGTVNITTVFDEAGTGYYTSGSNVSGYNTITENGDTKTERINVDTGSHKGIKAGTKAATKSYKDGTATTVTDASGAINISGGTITIDTTGAGLKANSVSDTTTYKATSSGKYIIGAPDDAIHSNNDISITGGNITVKSSDDGIGAAGKLSITGTATIDVQTAYEGMEAGEIIIGTNDLTTGPSITLFTKDDGINASSKTVTYTYDSADNDDYNYTKTSVSQKGNSCKIYSGTLIVKIDSNNTDNKNSVTLRNGSSSESITISFTPNGDGIDCNGTLDIEGGTVYVFGQSSGDNSPIDHDDGFTLGKNATLLAVGSNGMSSESIPKYGDGIYVTTGSSSGAPGGDGGDRPELPGNNGRDGASENGNGPLSPQSDLSATGPGGQPGQNDQSGLSFSAGSTLYIKSGSNNVFSYVLPYSAGFAIYASSKLTADTAYTISNGTSSISATAVQLSGSSSGSGDSGDSGNDDDSDTPDQGDDSSDDTSGQDPVVTPEEDSSQSGENTVFYKAEMVKGQKNSFGSGSWTTSDATTVSVVKSNGIAYAKKAGTAVLTNSLSDGSRKVYTITVYAPSLSVTKLTLLNGIADSTSLTVNNTGSLPISWISSNPAVIAVSGNRYGTDGKAAATITPISKGTAKISACVGGIAYTANITVTDTTPSVKLADSASLTLNVFQNYTPKFSSGFKASGAVWTDADENLLEFDMGNVWHDPDFLITITKSGRIKALKTGKITIKGIDTRNNKNVTLNITAVAVPVKTDIYLNPRQKTTLKHRYVSSSPVWSSDNEGIVTLSDTGKPQLTITAGNTVGKTVLTCTYNDVVYKTTVHVEDPALTLKYGNYELTRKSATAYNYTLTLKKGDSFRLVQRGVTQKVTWKSSSRAKAFVSDSGTIYARNKGTATISAKLNNKTVKVRVTVTE